MHVPIDEGRNRVDVAGTSIITVVQHIVFKGCMLKDASEDEVPSTKCVRQKHVHGWQWAPQDKTGSKVTCVDQEPEASLEINP